MTRARPPAAVALLAAAALALTACAPEVDRAWAPPPWPESAISVTSYPEPLDAALVPLEAQRLRNDALGIQARFSAPYGRSALGDRVIDLVRGAIRAQGQAAGVAYSPQPAPPGTGLGDRACSTGSTTMPAAELLSDPDLGPENGSGTAVTCDIVAAHGAFLGERMRVTTGAAGAVLSDETTLLYSDTATGDVVTGEGLWSEGAADRLWADVVDALRRDAGALSLAPLGSPTDDQRARISEALADTAVAPDGSLVFRLASGFESPELAALAVPATTEPLAIAVPPAHLPELASEIGARLSAAVAGSEPFAAEPPAAAGFQPVDCTLVPCVALTYDDGPSSLTPRLLDILRDARAAATFFVLGQSVRNNPDPVRRAAAEGHDIAGHTWDHPRLPDLDDAAIAGQIGGTRELLRSLSGQPAAMFRPPYGEYDDRVLAAAGLPAILWTVDTRDWAGPADSELLAAAVERPRAGGIVLFHDTHERSVRLAPDVIAGLRDRGFTLVTVTQLFGGTLPAGGGWRGAA